MTIEASLRKRAVQARQLEIVWILLSILSLIAFYISLPFTADRVFASVVTLANASQNTSVDEDNIFLIASGILFVGLIAILVAAYICTRNSITQHAVAARFSGLADALCIAGTNISDLEKAVSIFVPRTQTSSVIDSLPTKDLKTLVDFLKQLRP